MIYIYTLLMNNSYTREEKIAIIVEITKKLHTFPSTQGNTMNLMNLNYSFVPEFKRITREWINNENQEVKGILTFEEIGKHFEYDFPKDKNKEPLFVLRA